jgi:hypothetical protein
MTNIPLFKGYEDPSKQIIALWLERDFRIEMLEDIHIHFGDNGKYRLELSKQEFLELADAMERVEI